MGNAEGNRLFLKPRRALWLSAGLVRSFSGQSERNAACWSSVPVCQRPYLNPRTGQHGSLFPGHTCCCTNTHVVLDALFLRKKCNSAGKTALVFRGIRIRPRRGKKKGKFRNLMFFKCKHEFTEVKLPSTHRVRWVSMQFYPTDK